MTLLHFHRLSPVNQQNYALKEGTHLADRQEPKYLIRLYAVNDYYVEFFFYKKVAQAVKITAFENTNLLQPYLAQIDLSEIHSYH